MMMGIRRGRLGVKDVKDLGRVEACNTFCTINSRISCLSSLVNK